MTVSERRRKRRRQKFVRGVKKSIFQMIIAPARMPRIAGEVAHQVTRACEISGVIFAAMMFLYFVMPEMVNILFVLIPALLFVLFLFVLKLGDYQAKLEELKMYGII